MKNRKVVLYGPYEAFLPATHLEVTSLFFKKKSVDKLENF